MTRPGNGSERFLLWLKPPDPGPSPPLERDSIVQPSNRNTLPKTKTAFFRYLACVAPNGDELGGVA